MTFETASLSCRGGRPYNEDAVRCETHEGTCAVVVADGLGGHGGGREASAIVSNTLVEAFLREPVTEPGLIKQFMIETNEAVLRVQTPSQKMKSTGVGLFIREDIAIWAHAGDSRLYRFEDGTLTAWTLDHSVSQMAVYAGEITREQIRGHADRNRVLRAFGDASNFKPEISDPFQLSSGFYAFLLCTDGFWEYVTETEMEIELAKSETPDGWLQGLTWRLAHRAPKQTNDNFTAAAVFIRIGNEGGAYAL